MIQTAQEVAESLRYAIEEDSDTFLLKPDEDTDTLIEELDALGGHMSIRSYEEAGILTSNTGFVVRLPNGCEFQVTVVKSR